MLFNEILPNKRNEQLNENEFVFTQQEISSLIQAQKPSLPSNQSNEQVKDVADATTSTAIALNPPAQIHSPLLNNLINNVKVLIYFGSDDITCALA